MKIGIDYGGLEPPTAYIDDKKWKLKPTTATFSAQKHIATLIDKHAEKVKSALKTDMTGSKIHFMNVELWKQILDFSLAKFDFMALANDPKVGINAVTELGQKVRDFIMGDRPGTQPSPMQ